MNWIIKGLSALLLIGAGLHVMGSFMAFRRGSAELVWSIGSAGLATLIAALGWLLAGRDDPALALVTAVACGAWVALVLAFGHAIGKLADARVLYHVLVGLALGVALFL